MDVAAWLRGVAQGRGSGAWLRGVGLERYEQLFRDNAIDEEVLPDLDEGDLERLGIPLGHRKRLLRAIAALRVRIGERDEADRFASALEDYTSQEALPWADYPVTRARALAGFGRGRRDAGTVRALGQLREEAERAGMRMAAAATARRLGDG